MNCTDFHLLLDDHLDGALDAEIEAELLEHAAACAACASRREFGGQLRQSLQALPVPAPAAGFAERVLTAARNTRPDGVAAARTGPQRGLPRWATAGALAASLALALGLWATRENPPEAGPPVARVQLAAAAGVQPVRLVFRSASALSNVTIELSLPEGVELAGYPDQRRLVWQSDLRAGANLLELPVLLRGPGGVVTATLNHGTERRRFSVRVVSVPHTGVTPAPRVPRRGAVPAPVTDQPIVSEEHHHA